MRKVKSFTLFFFAFVTIILQSCVKESDYFQETAKKPESSYFDFATKRNVTLNVDYGFIGHTALLEVYTLNENSNNTSFKERIISNKKILNDSEMASLNVKLNPEPIYKAFTNSNCSFTGQIEIPSYVNKIYICSESLGIPRCLEIEIKDNVASYSYAVATKSAASVASKTMTSINIENKYRTVDSQYKLYSLYDTFVPGRGEYYWQTKNEAVESLYSVISLIHRFRKTALLAN